MLVITQDFDCNFEEIAKEYSQVVVVTVSLEDFSIPTSLLLLIVRIGLEDSTMELLLVKWMK